MARITATGSIVQLVHDGKVYKPDSKGVFHVPDAAVNELLPHGFVLIRDEAEKRTAPKPVPSGRSHGHGGR